MIKVLKSTSANFKELEKLNSYLSEKGIELHQTPYNGIIYKIGDNFYKYYQEGEYPEVLPPYLEGKYVECDLFGNTDYYQKNN